MNSPSPVQRTTNVPLAPKSDEARALKTRVIRPDTSFWNVDDLEALWNYRDLLLILAWRDIRVRYKQTFLGLGWVILQPLASVFIFAVFFKRMSNVETDQIPYEFFTFAGILPWTFANNTLVRGTTSVTGSADLIKKVYFPRIYLPMSAILSGIVDYLVATCVLLVWMAARGYFPAGNFLLTFPLLTAMIFFLVFGMSLWLSAVNSRFRDVVHAVPFFLQLWIFASPVVYSFQSLSPSLRRWAYGNPLVGIIEGLRSSLFHLPWNWGALVGSTVGTTVLFLTGLIYFTATERSFADRV